MTIRSEPPGALVVLDGQEIGHTPVSVPFTYYGVREIRLVKDGYETMVIDQTVSVPWYQVPPLDFASEVLVPLRIKDYRDYEPWVLQPRTVTRGSDLLQRAEQTRAAGLSPSPEVEDRFSPESAVPQ